MWQRIHLKTIVKAAASGGGDTNKKQQQDSMLSSALVRHGDSISFVKPLILLAFICIGAILTAAAGHELVCDLKNNVKDDNCSLCGAITNNNNKYYNNKKPAPIPPPTHLIELGSRAIYTKDGAVNIFDFDRSNAAWVPRGQPIKETLKDYAGWSLSLSRDGNSLSIASPLFEESGTFGWSKTTTTTSKRSTRVFEYHVETNSWVQRGGGRFTVVDNDENASNANVVLEEAQFIMEIPEHGNESDGISVTRFS